MAGYRMASSVALNYAAFDLKLYKNGIPRCDLAMRLARKRWRHSVAVLARPVQPLQQKNSFSRVIVFRGMT